MPRPERELDPTAGPVESLATELRALRVRAGSPGYRELARRSGYSAAALANAAGGRRLPSLAVTLAFVDACGERAAAWEQRWRRAATQLNESLAARIGPSDERAPYLGLTSYGGDDADRFFGRRRMVEQFVEMLRGRRFVAVFGRSGSGKSSLLRAGLMPAFGGTAVLMMPGAEPLVALRSVLAEVPPSGPVLVVVDAFEQLFTVCREASERAAFVAELARLAGDSDGRCHVVVGVRADFYGHCAELPGLAGLLAGGSVPLGPLTEAELREIVQEPARQAGLSVERALLTKIVSEATGRPGSLPLVSHALLETWRQRRGSVLTLAGYEEAGGLTGAVARTAEMVYQRFDADRRATARQVLCRLVVVGEDAVDTARRVGRAELDLPDVDVVLTALTDARLLVLDRDTVELAHEALIEAWPRLYGWLHTDRDELRLHRQLTEATGYWLANGRDPDTVLHGARLRAWDGRSLAQLTPVERAFLAAGRDRHAREVAAGRRRVRLAFGGLTAAVVALGVLAAVALVQARRADDQRDLALARQLVAEAREQLRRDPELGLMLARQAYDMRHIAEAEAVLRQAVVGSRGRFTASAGQGQLLGVAYSVDGRRIASSGTDGTVRVWDVEASGKPRVRTPALHGTGGIVRSPAFSPDGRWLAAGDADGTVVLWDLATGVPTFLRGHTGAVSGVAFSPNGAEMASAALDGTVRIWDRTGRRAPRVIAVGDQPRAVAYSPDGRHLAASGDGPVWVWDGAGSGAPRVLSGHEGSVWGLAFSRDGRRLASAGADAVVRVWTLDRTDAPMVLRGDGGRFDTVAFGPDGAVAGGSLDTDAIHVWNADDPADPLVLRGHDGPVRSVAFSPDGRRLASGSGDGTLRLWDPGYPGDPQVWPAHDAAVRGLALNPAGDRLVSGGEDGMVHVRDAVTGADLLDLRGHSGAALGVALTADGRWIASAGRDATVRLWDTTGASPPVVLAGHVGPTHSVAFSPDGRRLAAAGDDGTVLVWDRGASGTDRAPTALRGHEGIVFGVAFSPDGSRIASAGQDGSVRIWTIDGAAPPIVLRDPVPTLVWSVAFSPDGRRVASSGHDGTVRIWNADGTGQPLVLAGHEFLVWDVAFSPDGRFLATSAADGTMRIWYADGTALVTYEGQRSLTEQVRFAPDGRHLITAHRDGTIRRWQCEACLPIGEVRALADARLTRPMSPDEQRAYLGRAPRVLR